MSYTFLSKHPLGHYIWMNVAAIMVNQVLQQVGDPSFRDGGEVHVQLDFLESHQATLRLNQRYVRQAECCGYRHQ